MSTLVRVKLPSGNFGVYEVESLAKADGSKKTPMEIRWYEKHLATKFPDGWHVYRARVQWSLAPTEDAARFDAAPLVEEEDNG